MEATASNPGIIKVTIGMLVGVLSLLAYLFLGARNETIELQKSLTNKVEQLSAAQQKLDSISGALDDKIIEVRQLGGSLTELEKIKSQLEADRRKLKYDLSFSVQKYQYKIKEYETFLVTKGDDIRRVKAENGSLLSRAKALEAEKMVVINENAGLKTEREALTKTVADYSAQNDDLKRKVTLAAAMKAVNVDVAALLANGKERSGGIYKSSRIQRLRISFIMPANPLAIKNEKDIYVRILENNSSVVSESGVGGSLLYEGKEIGYSIRQSVPFENNDQQVAIFYKREASYRPGRYTVELYSEGFKIGGGSFEVK